MVETSVGRPWDCLIHIYYVDEEMVAQGHYVIKPGDRLYYGLFCPEPKAQLGAQVSDGIQYSSHTTTVC